MNKWLFLALSLFLLFVSAAVTLADEVMFAEGGTVTSVVSNVQLTKGWKRTYVIGEEGGTLKDASNSIADYQAGAAVEAAAGHLSEIVEAAHEGLTNALECLYAVTNNVGEFTDRIWLAGDLQADTDRLNWWCYIASESFDGTDDIFYIWFSNDLGNPPRILFRYSVDIGSTDAEAVWDLPWSSNTHDIGNFRGCHRCKVRRPANVGRAIMRVNSYPMIGDDATGLDFARKTFAFVDGTVTNMPWTGVWTNSAGRVWQFNNGIFTGETENE